MLKRLLPRIILPLVMILAFGGGLSQADHPSPLPDVIATSSFSYNVRYTNDNPPPATGANYLPTEQAQNLANTSNDNKAAATDNPKGYHNGYANLGLLAPDFSTGSNDVFDCSAHNGCDNGNAPADRINMPAPNCIGQTEFCMRRVIGHEVFHHVQYSYITFGQWLNWGHTAIEGTSRMMEDNVYSDIDGNICSSCLNQVNGFLGSPNQRIWDASYYKASVTSSRASALTERPRPIPTLAQSSGRQRNAGL